MKESHVYSQSTAHLGHSNNKLGVNTPENQQSQSQYKDMLFETYKKTHLKVPHKNVVISC